MTVNRNKWLASVAGTIFLFSSYFPNGQAVADAGKSAYTQVYVSGLYVMSQIELLSGNPEAANALQNRAARIVARCVRG